MKLVDEQQDIAVGLGDFGKHRFQALFKFAAVLRTRDERAHIEGEERLPFQCLGHVALDDPLRQSFCDRRLADARLTDEHGVVLGLARQNADDVADLLVTPDDGFELVLARPLGEIRTVLVQRLIGILGVVAGHVLIAAHLLHALQELVLAQPEAGEDVLQSPFVVVEQAQKEVLDGDILVLHAGGELLRLGKDAVDGARRVRLRAARSPRKPLYGVLDGGGKPVRVRARTPDDAIVEPVSFEQGTGEMQRRQLGIAVFDGKALRALDRLQ